MQDSQLSNKSILLTVGAVVLFLGVGCTRSPSGSTSEPVSSVKKIENLESNIEKDLGASAIDGNARFYLTDARIDDTEVKEVNIWVHGLLVKARMIASVEAKEGVATSDLTTEGGPHVKEGDLDRRHWKVLKLPEPIKVNLLDLQNGLAEALGDLELETGLYKEIRLLVSQGEVVLEDGTSEVLKIPGGERNGLKIKFRGRGFLIEADKKYVITLDFDVEKSLKRRDHAVGPRRGEDTRDKSGRNPREELISLGNGFALDGTVVRWLDDDGHDVDDEKTEEGDVSDEAENEPVENSTWILKPVLKVIHVAAVAEGNDLQPIVVDDSDEADSDADESDSGENAAPE